MPEQSIDEIIGIERDRSEDFEKVEELIRLEKIEDRKSKKAENPELALTYFNRSLGYVKERTLIEIYYEKRGENIYESPEENPFGIREGREDDRADEVQEDQENQEEFNYFDIAFGRTTEEEDEEDFAAVILADIENEEGDFE